MNPLQACGAWWKVEFLGGWWADVFGAFFEDVDCFGEQVWLLLGCKNARGGGVPSSLIVFAPPEIERCLKRRGDGFLGRG